jgi:NADH-quinone oxidoreductase subunit M
MLWLYQRMFFGKASESLSHHMPDLTPREWAAIVPLVILMVWMGSFAQSFLPSISVQNATILEQTKKLRTERVAIPARPAVEVSRANR